jgi:O-antigen/teichoic acid export membrane protein
LTPTRQADGAAFAVDTERAGQALPDIEAACGSSSFLRHLLLFSCANLGSLLCNGALPFLLPRWLSMESYGEYRLFVLYGGFAGALHFGLLDGALVRWAAHSRRRLRAELRPSLAFLLLQQGALLLPAIGLLVIWFRHQPWFLVGLAVLLYAVVWNAAVLGQFALQAEKSFVLLSAATFIQPALLLGAVVGLNHGKHLTLEALLATYLAAMLAAGIGVWTFLFGKHRGKKYPRKMRSAGYLWQLGCCNVATGWNILVAALLTNVALSLDRVVVSLSFAVRDFAIYSLAATALAAVNTIVLSVSQVVFPYLSDGLGTERRQRAYGWGEACALFLWAASLAGYFPLRMLVQFFLPAYVLSLPILRLLMLTTGMTAMIYILHSNYFRSSLRQGGLLVGASTGILAAALSLAVARHTGKLPNMSWAMLGAISLWWTVDELLLRDLTGRTLHQIGKSLLFSAACSGCFLVCASVSSTLIGLVSYGIAAALLTTLAYGETLRSLPRIDLGLLLSPGARNTEV